MIQTISETEVVLDKWTIRYLNLAGHIATWSKDPSSKIGCVAVDIETGRILAQGYNGFPRGIEDSEERLNERETKYKYVVHAEKNCVYNACLNGVSLKGCAIYVSGLPVCAECAKALIQVGVSKVFATYNATPEALERWKESTETTKAMFAECGIEYTLVDFKPIQEWNPKAGTQRGGFELVCPGCS